MVRNWVFFILLLVISLGGLTWGNYVYAKQNPGGNDFLPRWVGIRMLIIEGKSPYSDEVARRIQQLAYGRAARSGEDEMRFVYPLYSGLLFAPYALIDDYHLARAFWMTTLEIALLATALLLLLMTDWRPSTLVLVFFFLFISFWYHSIRPLINGNVVVLLGFFLVMALWLIRSEADEGAGILLALATIKPHVVLLGIAFILVWAYSHRRWRLIIWFFSSLILLIVIGMMFIPDWILQNLREVFRYTSYTPPGTLMAVFGKWWPGIGRKIAWAIIGLLALDLLFEWLQCWGKDFRWFLWTTSLTLVVSQWIGIQTDPGNFVLLLLPLVLVFAVLEERWSAKARIPIVISMIVLWVGLWVLFLETLIPGQQPQQHAIMFFPLPLILLISLYWVRWWAIRPRRSFLDALRSL